MAKRFNITPIITMSYDNENRQKSRPQTTLILRKFVNFHSGRACPGVALMSLAFVLILVSGCGTGKPLLLSEEPALGKMKESYPSPLAYEVGVEAVVLENQGAEKLMKAEELSKEVASVLDGSIVRKASPGKMENGYALKINVSDFEMSYTGRAGMSVTSVLVWFAFSPIGSMMMGDEGYEASAKVTATLEDGEMKKLWSARFEASAECGLSDFQRGWTVWDLYIPGPLSARPNIEKASEYVMPHFYRDVQLKMLDAIGKNPIPPPVADIAIIIGAGKYQEGVEAKAEYAVADAKAFAAFVKRQGGEYLEDTFFEFSGEVSARQVMEIVEKLSKRRDIRPGKAVFYYAGCGRVSDGRHELLMSDGAVSVAELAEKLSGLGCFECSMILDCGFSGRGGRCVAFEGDAPDYPDEAMKSEKVSAVFACAPGQSAYEDKNTGSGVFTSEMLGYFEGKSGVTGDELVRQIGFKVSRRARDCGAERQEPVFGGAEAPTEKGKDE